MKAIKLRTTLLVNPTDFPLVSQKELAEHLSLVTRGFLRARGLFSPGNHVIVELDQTPEGDKR